MELTQKCDWNNLMSVLTSGEEDKNIQKEGIFAYISDIIHDENQKALTGTTCRIIIAWYMRSKNLQAKSTVTYLKKVLDVSELSTRAREIYGQILIQCPTDEDILKVKHLIDEGPPVDRKVSGRTIDTLVTRFPKFHNSCYYLDVTDPKNSKIVTQPDYPGRTTMLFDIGSSYRKKMTQYSKTYFDCFGRGDEVEHKLQNGEVINISICQFTFFIWASRFQVFEFLKDQFQKVIVVRQQCQKNTYKPKRRKRRKTKQNQPIVIDLKRTVLCPSINSHKRIKKANVDKVLICSSANVPYLNKHTRSKSLFDYYK
jgi:hypothetical protein